MRTDPPGPGPFRIGPFRIGPFRIGTSRERLGTDPLRAGAPHGRLAALPSRTRARRQRLTGTLLIAVGIAVIAATLDGRTLARRAQADAAVAGDSLPPIVFVSRHAPKPWLGRVPGLGPLGRTLVLGGRLLVREPGGRLRELVPAATFADVCRPAVSPDAKRVAFAAVRGASDPWRLWLVNLDGSGLRALTRDDRALPAGLTLPRLLRRYDDVQPSWRDSTHVIFASTRYPQRSEYGDVAVTNLFEVTADGPARPPRRLTSERNGAESPSFDVESGVLLFSRWWFNRWRPSNAVALGVTTDAALAVPGDSVNLWQPMRVAAGSGHSALAAGDARSRLRGMGYQPTMLAGGAIATVYALNLGLFPRPGPTGIWIFDADQRFGAPRRLAGAAVPESPADPYSAASGLAAPSACSPAGLPDGRILFAYDAGARGDFGLWVASADGESLARVVDLPGTLELDPAPVVRREPRVMAGASTLISATRLAPATRAEELRRSPATFTFHDLDVFAESAANGGSGESPPRVDGARIRFFGALARPFTHGGDTVIVLREVAVGRDGEVLQRGLPADAPLFEQLVDSAGRVLMSAHDPAHVRGFNVGRAGAETRCVGCHVGHSTLPVP